MKFRKLIKLFHRPQILIELLIRPYRKWQKEKLWLLFDKTIEKKARLIPDQEGKTILIDGFWDNPNQFYRLNLLLKAFSLDDKTNFIGLVKNKNDRSKNTLIAMGVKELFYIEDTIITKEDRESAKNLLENISSHKDILNLKLPSNFPPHFFFDTVLSKERHPQPNLKKNFWQESLSDVFRLDRFYKNLFKSKKIDLIILSHPWKNEFAMALTQGLALRIDCYYINALYETMRIKRYRNMNDLLRPPESINYKEFNSLNKYTRENISKAGETYLKIRSKGKNSDINEQKAYSKKEDPNKFLIKNRIKKRDKIVTIFCHAWYDYPHAMGMKNFSDFLDWIKLTIEIATDNKSVTWILKPHPTESWYGGFYLKDYLKKLPNHIHIIDESNSVSTILEISDIIVTVHGTIAIEASAKGIPVIAADKNYYEDWNFAKTIKSRSEYISTLKNINKEKRKITNEMINNARSFAYLSISPAEEKINIQRLIADHKEPKILFNNLINLLNHDSETISKQVGLIKDWIQSDNDNFCIHHKIEFHHHNNINPDISDL